jgi:hypothetical protein
VSAPRKDINGRTYAFGTLPATQALRVELAIAPVLADALAAFGTAAVEKLSEDMGALMTARAAGEVLKRLSAEDFTAPDGSRHMGLLSIMETVFSVVTVIDRGKASPVNIDQTFTGKPADKYHVLVEALKVNFADFFPAAPLKSSHTETPGASNQ